MALAQSRLSSRSPVSSPESAAAAGTVVGVRRTRAPDSGSSSRPKVDSIHERERVRGQVRRSRVAGAALVATATAVAQLRQWSRVNGAGSPPRVSPMTRSRCHRGAEQARGDVGDDRLLVRDSIRPMAIVADVPTHCRFG